MNFLDETKSISPLPWPRVAPRLGKEDLRLDEAASLLTEEAGSRLEDLARASHALTVRRFGRTIKLYSPVYLSNACINGCLYCGFKMDNDVKRRTLTDDEAIAEARSVMARGHRHLLLVAGEDPAALSIERLRCIVRSLRPHVAGLAIEVQPFDLERYALLAEAGVDGVTLYQETYDRRAYDEFHPYGPKSDFAARLAAMDAAGAAGMRFLGIGALLGLADWRRDALSLIAHARHLMKRFWRSHVTISVPRVRDCASGFEPPHPVSDRELAQLICALRLALPDAGIVLSTREPALLRDNLLPLGVTQMSAGSITSPGGYSEEESGGPPASPSAKPWRAGRQFEREDARSPKEFAAMLTTRGYDPLWKDWDAALSG